jgi:hypothetical protein
MNGLGKARAERTSLEGGDATQMQVEAVLSAASCPSEGSLTWKEKFA